MLKHASVTAKSACAAPTGARAFLPAAGVLLPKRHVRCNYRKDEQETDKTFSTPTQKSYTTPTQYGSSYRTSSTGNDYYSGYTEEDPLAGLKDGWRNLMQRWEEWPAENRNAALIYGSGALLTLYIANAVLDAVERVPIIPGLLKIVGLLYSSWFFYRYLLFAEGRADLATDITSSELFGKTGVTDRLEDVPDKAAGAMKSSTASSSKGSSRGSTGSSTYTGRELDNSISSALHDMDKIADDISTKQ